MAAVITDRASFPERPGGLDIVLVGRGSLVVLSGSRLSSRHTADVEIL